MASQSRWVRVSRRNPCPICHKLDNCEVSEDGAVVWCGRVSAGSVQQNAGGQYLHRLKDSDYAGHWRADIPHDADSLNESVGDWDQRAAYYASDSAPRIDELAKLLGVSYSSLAEQGAGWSDLRKSWTFCERNGAGQIVGILTRDRAGNKRRIKGSRSGLSFAPDWKSGTGPIHLVEGASDVAALRTIGLSVVGRPSNSGGVAFLTDLLFDLPPERPITVIGERDQKPSGLWPGREGAISVSTRLAEALERPIGWAFPPDNAKDSRAWLQAMPPLPPKRLADLFTSGLDVTLVPPPMTFEVAPETGNLVGIDTWRGSMRDARLHSLEAPGIYLDRSTTGAGKSHVDFQAVIQLLRGGRVA